jgi:hypothetical protein
VSDINVTFFENIAVIIELRPARILIPIVLNVLQNIPESWRIQIFHCKLNAYFINSSRLSTYIESGKIILTEIDDYSGRFNTFKNTLMTNISFWKQIRGEKVLFFQIDSIMCSNSPHTITEYLQYDYVGVTWENQPDRVGNGGFSLRSRRKTLLLLRNVAYIGDQNENIWFAQRLASVGIVAPVNVSKTFVVETIYYSNPLAVHNLRLDKKELKKLCDVCPEARLVPPYCIG